MEPDCVLSTGVRRDLHQYYLIFYYGRLPWALAEQCALSSEVGMIKLGYVTVFFKSFFHRTRTCHSLIVADERAHVRRLSS